MKRHTMIRTTRSLISSALSAMALLAVHGTASAQTHTLRIIVGYPAGGAPDAVARLFGDQLRQLTGTNVVVDNKTGASGKIAMDSLLSAPADGQTIALIPSGNLLITPMTVKSVKYDSSRDFVPLASVAENGFALAVGPAAPNGSLGAFLAWAKLNPGKASFATPGLGTPQHFLGATLAKAADVELTHVPYRGGAPALNDVLGGQVPALITTEQLVATQHTAGKLRALMVTSPRRNPKMPDVPTARESGFPQMESSDWFGLFAKAGTPPNVVADLQKASAKVLASDSYKRALAEMGYDPPKMDASKLPARVLAEKDAWAKRIAASGFTASD